MLETGELFLLELVLLLKEESTRKSTLRVSKIDWGYIYYRETPVL